MHYSALVLLTQDGEILNREADMDHVEEAVRHAMTPYDENMDCEIPQRCWCVGRKLKDETLKIMYDQLDKLRDQPHSDEEWDTARDKFYREALAEWKQADGKDAPDPECEECHGSGQYLSGNPNGHWDWWQIGGRWTGLLDGYDPDKDPANQETCNLCNGTGKRTDEVAEQNPHLKEKCNGCEGTGIATKWPTQWAKHPGDIQPVAVLLEKEDLSEICTYAVITPDRQWFNHGEHYRFDYNFNWEDDFRRLLEKHKDCIAVVVDFHN